MTSKRAKGSAFQRWVKAWIEKNYEGSVVHNQPTQNPITFIKDGKVVYKNPKGNDIFGCIDLIAIVPGCAPIFIQATMDDHTTKRLKDMVKVPWPLGLATVQLWQDKGGGRKIVKQLTRELKEGVMALRTRGEIIRGKCNENLFD